jgi:hypothetical protein
MVKIVTLSIKKRATRTFANRRCRPQTVLLFYAPSYLLMFTFLIRCATSQSSSYLVALTTLGESRSRSNILLILLKCGIKPATSWLVVRHASYSPNEAVLIVPIWKIFNGINISRGWWFPVRRKDH